MRSISSKVLTWQMSKGGGSMDVAEIFLGILALAAFKSLIFLGKKVAILWREFNFAGTL